MEREEGSRHGPGDLTMDQHDWFMTIIGVILFSIIVGTALIPFVYHPPEPPEYNSLITVKSVHYLTGGITVPCMVLTVDEKTYGVSSVSDCMRLENGINQSFIVFSNDRGQITKAKRYEV